MVLVISPYDVYAVMGHVSAMLINRLFTAEANHHFNVKYGCYTLLNRAPKNCRRPDENETIYFGGERYNSFRLLCYRLVITYWNLDP